MVIFFPDFHTTYRNIILFHTDAIKISRRFHIFYDGFPSSVAWLLLMIQAKTKGKTPSFLGRRELSNIVSVSSSLNLSKVKRSVGISVELRMTDPRLQGC